jgi:hypothetical protein
MMPLCKSAQEEFKMIQFLILLKEAQWLTAGDVSDHTMTSSQPHMPVQHLESGAYCDCSPRWLKEWMKEIRIQETTIAESQHNAFNPDNQVEHAAVRETSGCENTTYRCDSIVEMEGAPTQTDKLSPADIINNIDNEFQLNKA